MTKLIRVAFLVLPIIALAASGCNGNGNGDPTCPADADCTGMECGLDPVCGTSCGKCGADQNCVAGQCEGINCPDDKDCSGRECGPDPVCDESCGDCGQDESCDDGQCSAVVCPDDKDCTGLECGPDPVCDEDCGECTGDQVCLEGLCATVSCPDDKDCYGRNCGVDPVCCESCGMCDPGESCGLDGICTGWPPALDSLYAPCAGCIFPACDMQGDPGWDFSTDVAYYKKDLHTIASDCPDILQDIDERTRPGAWFYELDSLAMTGTCLYPTWPGNLGGGSAYDGIIGVCAYWEEAYGPFTFSIQYWATVDHTLDPPTGFGYVVLGKLPEDLLGVTECTLDVDVTMQKCPQSMDCDSVSCGPDPTCLMDCGDCEQGNTCSDEGRCCPAEQDCTGRDCGPDPVCGESCGECAGGAPCSDEGTCPVCPDDQDCGNQECGQDPVCGLPCGACLPGQVCLEGTCFAMGTPAETVDVPAGTFMMGCNDAVDDQCNPFEVNEEPYHQVNLAAYKINKYEVTAAEYQACVDAGACSAAATSDGEYTYGVAGKEDHPINGTDWSQAWTFCAWVGGSLPTEAQWEKAARGESGLKYPWGDTPAVSCDLAVVPDADEVDGCGTGETMPVGSKPDGVSPYGALDMVGSVWEWVNDYYSADYYANSPSDDPLGPDSGDKRVIRGGSWSMPNTDFLRASMRQRNTATFESDSHGFRCVLPAD